MEVNIWLFFACALLMLCVVRLLRPDVSQYEMAFLILGIGAIIYAAYMRYTSEKESQSLLGDKVKSVLELVKDSLREVKLDDSSIEFTIPIQKVLQSDQVLLKALLALTKYATYDKDVVYSIIKDLVLFYELYADLLLGVKDVKMFVQQLIDLRYKVMGQTHTLYVSMPHSKHTKVFEHVALIIQSSTYKCMNVLKNKYGVSNHEPPLAENTFESSFSLY